MSETTTMVVLAAIFSATFIAYLVFLLRLVGKTNDSKSMVDAATAIRAFMTGHDRALRLLIEIFRRK